MKSRHCRVLECCVVLVTLATVSNRLAAQTLSASPGAVDFEYSAGQSAPAAVTVAITASPSAAANLAATVIPAGATPSGLFTATVSGVTVSVGIDDATLASLANQTGLYTAYVSVTATGFPTLNIPVAVSIGSTFSIAATPAALIFNGVSGVTAQTVALSGPGGAAVAFTVTSAMTTGANWLTVSSNSSYTPAVLTVSVSATGLNPGTYTGTITVTPESGGTVTIPVTFQTTGSSGTLTATPAVFSFNFEQGTVGTPQILQLSSSAPNTYTAQASSSGDWLVLNGSTAPATGTLPVSLDVGIELSGLPAGAYTGAIAVKAADGSTLNIPVTLTVTSVSTLANPTSLTFVSQAGSPTAPGSQIVAVNPVPSSTYTAVVTSGSSWLAAAPSTTNPEQLNVSATPGSLVAGDYSGNIAITAGTQIENIPVTLIVSSGAVLTTNPGAIVFFDQTDNLPIASTNLSVSVSSGSPQTFSVTSGQAAWLVLNNIPSKTTPATIAVSVNPTGLTAGTYVSNAVLTPAAQGGTPVTVPIMVVVSPPPGILVTPGSLTFTAAPGATPATQTIGVTANTSTPFTASATTTSGGNWLNVAPTSGTASTTSINLSVTATAASLAAGTYQGTVTLTTNAGVVTQIPVTFAVASAPFTVAPTTLAFAYTQNGTFPASQTVQVTGAEAFTASASTVNTGTWLSVSPMSGTGNASLTVSVNPSGLTVGTYTGTITLTPVNGIAQTVAVTLIVTAEGLTINPTSLAFAFVSGGSVPTAQTVAVNATGAAIAFTASASSSGWLSVSPASGTTPATLTVSVNPADLGSGTYTGSITISAGSSAPAVTVAVTISVTAPLPIIQSVANAASYQGGGVSPGEIAVIFGSSLGPATGVSATVNSGFIPTSLANVQVTFNGYPAPVLYASAGQINLVVPYEVATASNSEVEVTFGKARSNTLGVPVVASFPGIFSANASGTGGGAILDVNYHLVNASNPTSPGAIIQIYATGAGQTIPPGVDGEVTGLTPPFPTINLVPGLLIGGLPATIDYIGAAPGLVAGALQINATVPSGVASGAVPVVLMIGNNSSQPGITVTVQ
jgi:uncharacterized protein (TIGR03437 family)